MKLLEGCGRLLKLSFYLALGGASALAGACGGTQRSGDSGVDGGHEDAASDGAADADHRDGSTDATGDGHSDGDAPTDGSADADMWDVIYE
jgi:hypothetical protein